MSEQCERLREWLPSAGADPAGWPPAERDHLAACADCAAEWRVIQTSRRLGEAAVARLDPAGLTASVLLGVARERRRLGFRRAGWLSGLAAAAAVVLLLWYRGPESSRQVAAGADAEFTLPLAELEGLDSDQLGQILDGLEVPLDQGAGGEVPRFGELDDQQLERVLRSLEG